jgi:hypothetical protein
LPHLAFSVSFLLVVSGPYDEGVFSVCSVSGVEPDEREILENTGFNLV